MKVSDEEFIQLSVIHSQGEEISDRSTSHIEDEGITRRPRFFWEAVVFRITGSRHDGQCQTGRNDTRQNSLHWSTPIFKKNSGGKLRDDLTIIGT
jgi:hypothetical protein